MKVKNLIVAAFLLVSSSMSLGVVTHVIIPKSVKQGVELPITVSGYRSDSCENVPYIHGSKKGNVLTVHVDTYYDYALKEFIFPCLEIIYPFSDTVVFEDLEIGKYEVDVIDHDTLVVKRNVLVREF